MAMRCRSLLFALVLAVPAVSQVAAPPALQPPKDQVLMLQLKGKGHQIYVCEVQDGKAGWKFKEPEAHLYNNSGKLIGRHFAGPTWEAKDRSRVIGKVVASAPSPIPNAIPWLLLTAVFHDDKGVFSKIRSIQRIATKGGVAPSTGCNSGNNKAVTKVFYEATYYFYGKS